MALALRAWRPSSCCRWRRCRRSISHHRGVRRLPGASPETMASSVATPLERQSGPHRRRHRDDVDESVGSTRSCCSSTSSRNIDGAARDVQAAINAARGRAARGPAEQSDLPQEQPGRRADRDLSLTSDTRTPGADLRRGLHHPAAEAVAGGRRRRRSLGGAARCRRCGSTSTRGACTNTASALEEVRARCPRANANRPQGATRRRQGTRWQI